MFSPLALAAEYSRRAGIWDSLFPAQLAAIRDKAPLKCYQCDRRAGKTTTVAADFSTDSLDFPRCEYAYVALTSRSARQIAWPIFREFDHAHRLNARLRENLLRIELPNKAALTLYGADRPDWMDRLLGQKLRKVWIDEAAFYSVSLRRLVYEILQPTVSDLRGQITLMSTPGHILRGLFYDIVERKKTGGWSVHKWSWRDNPHMVDQVNELLARESDGNPGFLDWPSTRRMWFNEWAVEAGTKVYQFDPDRNGIAKYPITSDNVHRHKFVLGIDFGWTHCTAFAIGCWSADHERWIELESYKERHLDIPGIAQRIRMYQDYYPGMRVVGDHEAGREIDELTKRYGIAIEPAQKQAKGYWINQYNADLATGKIQIVGPESSPHAEEMIDLTWETDADGNPIVHHTTKEMVESRRAENDCCDAALFAYRASLHHRHVPAVEPPAKGSSAYYDAIAEAMEREEEQEFLEYGPIR